jgi:hypothetical protein
MNSIFSRQCGDDVAIYLAFIFEKRRPELIPAIYTIFVFSRISLKVCDVFSARGLHLRACGKRPARQQALMYQAIVAIEQRRFDPLILDSEETDASIALSGNNT